MIRTSRARLGVTAIAASAAVSVLLAGASADAATSTYASRLGHAKAAVRAFEQNSFAELGLPARHALWVRACYRGVCAHDRLRPDPVCAPTASVCLGTALRAVRVTRRLTVEATYG